MIVHQDHLCIVRYLMCNLIFKFSMLNHHTSQLTTSPISPNGKSVWTFRIQNFIFYPPLKFLSTTPLIGNLDFFNLEPFLRNFLEHFSSYLKEVSVSSLHFKGSGHLILKQRGGECNNIKCQGSHCNFSKILIKYRKKNSKSKPQIILFSKTNGKVKTQIKTNT